MDRVPGLLRVDPHQLVNLLVRERVAVVTVTIDSPMWRENLLMSHCTDLATAVTRVACAMLCQAHGDAVEIRTIDERVQQFVADVQGTWSSDRSARTTGRLSSADWSCASWIETSRVFFSSSA